MLFPEFKLAGLAALAVAAAIASGWQLARLCPGPAWLRPAWAFVLGNALWVVILWNCSWLGFAVGKVAWLLVAGLPALNLAAGVALRRIRGIPQSNVFRDRRAWLFLLPIFVAFLWEAIPLLKAGIGGAVIYSAPEFHTNTSLAEWFATHSLTDNLAALPSDSSTWSAWRHITKHLRIGQHMVHALWIVLSGQSSISTWPLMSAWIVALQSTGAFLLGLHVSRSRVGWALAASLLIAAHPLSHAACLTSFISMAMGLAFLTPACTLVFQSAEGDVPLRTGVPIGLCALALFFVYQEILPVFVMVSGLFWVMSALALHRERRLLLRLCAVAALGVLTAAMLSPAGLIWNVQGLLRQSEGFAHGAAPSLAPEMMASLVTGLAQLPGFWEQLDRGMLSSSFRWLAALVLAGGIVLSLRRGRRGVAVASILGSTLLLFLLVLHKGGDPQALDYDLSRAILYHACLLFVFGIAGWSALDARFKYWSAAPVICFGLVFLGYSHRYFSNIFADRDLQVIPAIPAAPHWTGRLACRSILLFDASTREQLDHEIPIWRWLRGRMFFDTYLTPAPLKFHNTAVLDIPVRNFAAISSRRLPAGLKPLGSQGRLKIFRVTRPFVTPMNLIEEGAKQRPDDLSEEGALPSDARLRRVYWLCSPDQKLHSATLELRSPEPQKVFYVIVRRKGVLQLPANTPVRVTVPLDKRFYNTRFFVNSTVPVQISLIDYR